MACLFWVQTPTGGLELMDADGKGKMETVSVTGQPFTKALRLTTLQTPDASYKVQAGAWSKVPIQQGDVLLFTFYVRAIKGQAETGEARTQVGLATGGPNWSSSVDEAIGIPREWKRIDIPFTARYDMPAGGAIIGFHMGFAPQIFELGGVSLQNFGKTVRLADLPRTANTYAGQEENAPWRKAARERIEKIRKGDLAITVVDSSGKPVPETKISVRMKRHAFRFGSAVASDTLLMPGATGNKYREMITTLYNATPIENHLKWPFWETAWARPDADKSVDWLNEQEIALPISGPLVWGGWTNLPDDMKAKQTDKAALIKRLNEHILAQTAAYKGKIREWEVINEPYEQNDIWKIIGYDKMADVFFEARKAAPQARLTINDYPALDGAATHDTHLNTYYKYIADLQTAKAPVQGIGFQCHFGSRVVPPERVLSGLDRFAKFGLPISITEFDMDTTDEDLQARYMRDFTTAVFSHPATDALIMWGFWEGKHWLPNAALYRQDWSIKPNGQAWLDLVKRDWWTNADGKTDIHGAYQTRGFYGQYEITATAPDGKTKTVWYSLAKSGHPLILRLDGIPAVPPHWLALQTQYEKESAARFAAGVPLFASNITTSLNVLADKSFGVTEVVPVTAQSFSQATRLSVLKVPTNSWEVQALAVTQDDIKKGDAIRLSFWIRTAPGSGNSEGKVNASFQTGAPNYAASHAELITVSSDWKHVEIPFVSLYDSPSGGAMLALHLGYKTQSVEIGDLSATNFGSKAGIKNLPDTR